VTELLVGNPKRGVGGGNMLEESGVEPISICSLFARMGMPSDIELTLEPNPEV
jgi:hypothetical protein